MSKRAEMAAQYLKTEQWGKKETEQEEAERRSKWNRRRILAKTRRNIGPVKSNSGKSKRLSRN